jgi:hypothetical protein
MAALAQSERPVKKGHELNRAVLRRCAKLGLPWKAYQVAQAVLKPGQRRLDPVKRMALLALYQRLAAAQAERAEQPGKPEVPDAEAAQ